MTSASHDNLNGLTVKFKIMIEPAIYLLFGIDGGSDSEPQFLVTMFAQGLFLLILALNAIKHS
jgi:hypothetical protein